MDGIAGEGWEKIVVSRKGKRGERRDEEDEAVNEEGGKGWVKR
jgi:hypothetical protein